ncbi:uncharacterized protein [Miscanthus floridulus]|uniref:uncharacterized protein isoform X2 n=1 Tax=Miscanthus floridulus TaxID=154761 RepID=UPI00345A019B
MNRVSKQMNELKNECTELIKDRTKKDLQIKAKEAENSKSEKSQCIHISSGWDVMQACGLLASNCRFCFTGPCCPKSRIGSNYAISDICSGREDGA